MFLQNNKKNYLYKEYLTEILYNENNDIYNKYYNLWLRNITIKEFIIYLIHYKYQDNWKELNFFLEMLKALYKKENLESEFEKNIFIPNVYSITSFLSFIFDYVLKKEKNYTVSIIHDIQTQFEVGIHSEMSNFFNRKKISYEIKFEDEKYDNLLQIADNVVSVFNSLLKKILLLELNEVNYESPETKWVFSNFSLMVRKINIKNFFFGFPLSKRALLYTIINYYDKEISFKKFYDYWTNEIELESIKLNIKEKMDN